MKRFFACCSLILFQYCSNAQLLQTGADDGIAAKIQTQFGDSLQRTAFIHLHANEITALHVVKDFLQINKGNLFFVEHEPQRNIRFILNDSIFEFDPNRIFTIAGRKATLNPYSASADSIVKVFADKILSQVDAHKTIIAVHNNTPSNFSVRTYKKGGAYEREASKIYVSKKMDEDDFIFTTDERIFNKCKNKKLNVVLQDNIQCTDDGSLSVYCANANLSYTNIEAEFGHENEQMQMLKFIFQVTGTD